MSSAAASSSSATKEVENNFSPDSAIEIKKTPFLDELMKFDKEEKKDEEEVKKLYIKHNSEEYIAETKKMLEKIETYIEMLSCSSSTSGDDLETVAEGLAAIQRMMPHGTQYLLLPELINNKCNGIKKLIQCLDSSNHGVQFGAASCLGNICYVSHSNSLLVIEHGGVPRLSLLLQSPVENLRGHSAWILEKMIHTDILCYNSAAVRDQILNAGVMKPLIACLNSKNKNIGTLISATRCLVQLLKPKLSSLDFELVEVCLPTVRHLLKHRNTQVHENACWCVRYISDGDDARIKAVVKYDVMPLVLDLIKSQSICKCMPMTIYHEENGAVDYPKSQRLNLLPAVQTFGNFSATNPETSQIIIDLGVLNQLAPLLQWHISRRVRKEVCWLISNVCAGYDSQVEAVIEAGLIPPVIINMKTAEVEVRLETVWAAHNAVATANVDRIRFLVEGCDALDGLCNVLTTNDARICSLALEAIDPILLVGDTFRASNNGENPYADRIESIGGKDNISRLRDHVDRTVLERATLLMDRYFQDDDEENEEEGEEKEEEAEKEEKEEEEEENESDDGNNNNNGETQAPQKKRCMDVID